MWQIKVRGPLINIALGVVSIGNSIRGLLLTFERQLTISTASTVAEYGATLSFFVLGCALCLKYKRPLAELVRDRSMIALVGASTSLVLVSYFVTHGLTLSVFLFQLPSILILGIIIGWFIKCTRSLSRR